jgi:hypothetical protein
MLRDCPQIEDMQVGYGSEHMEAENVCFRTAMKVQQFTLGKMSKTQKPHMADKVNGMRRCHLS